MGIDASSILVPINIYNNGLMPTNNYKNIFYIFLLKGFPCKYCAQCFANDRSHR